MKLVTNFWAAVVVAGIAFGAAAAPARADDWSKTYQVNGHADVRVLTSDGDVTMTGASQNQIEAHVTTAGLEDRVQRRANHRKPERQQRVN